MYQLELLIPPSNTMLKLVILFVMQPLLREYIFGKRQFFWNQISSFYLFFKHVIFFDSQPQVEGSYEIGSVRLSSICP